MREIHCPRGNFFMKRPEQSQSKLSSSNLEFVKTYPQVVAVVMVVAVVVVAAVEAVAVAMPVVVDAPVVVAAAVAVLVAALPCVLLHIVHKLSLGALMSIT